MAVVPGLFITLIHQLPANFLPDLIYRDDALLVANKPAGLLAVPGRGADKQDCFSSRIQQGFPDALVVHRLDMATSGQMLFARGAEMQRLLSRMFRERAVQKRYIAIVAGMLETAAGEVNLPIAADWPKRPLRKIDVESGKPSLTRYRLLAYDAVAHTSRVELEPVTGRTHQLRVHMAAIGHPVLGDTLYGEATDVIAERLLLHASSLGFVHPVSGEPLAFLSEPSF
ncbi:MAG: RluA family pseudouridine synthase [Pseudomonadota bacterium]